MEPPQQPPPRSYPRGSAYDEGWRRMAERGQNIHGEADFVERLGVRTVLDAGCGTGRVAIELARRGFTVTGVDVDPSMLSAAREKAPDLDWRLEDLATVNLDRLFECIVLAGNVMIFLDPGSESTVLHNLARHLVPGGLLVAGFQLRPGGLTLERFDALAREAGLALRDRWSTWDEDPFTTGGNYAVSVHHSTPSS